jgi:hypothetical protein
VSYYVLGRVGLTAIVAVWIVLLIAGADGFLVSTICFAALVALALVARLNPHWRAEQIAMSQRPDPRWLVRLYAWKWRRHVGYAALALAVILVFANSMAQELTRQYTGFLTPVGIVEAIS